MKPDTQAFSCPVNDLGDPIVHPPAAMKTVIKPKDNTLCWFWQHEYVLVCETAGEHGNVPTGQLWACRKCGKQKLTAIPRPRL